MGSCWFGLIRAFVRLKHEDLSCVFLRAFCGERFQNSYSFNARVAFSQNGSCPSSTDCRHGSWLTLQQGACGCVLKEHLCILIQSFTLLGSLLMCHSSQQLMPKWRRYSKNLGPCVSRQPRYLGARSVGGRRQIWISWIGYSSMHGTDHVASRFQMLASP